MNVRFRLLRFFWPRNDRRQAYLYATQAPTGAWCISSQLKVWCNTIQALYEMMRVTLSLRIGLM